ncbi:lytic transglycosylase domain-containing protein [Cryptosporangium minutisporangium]|uniref:lytic transglycosylase domain-containing protein n=1 Tax=Cryptosporangium minutisporangium TaxID=113569 RepID=UPI0031E84A42
MSGAPPPPVEPWRQTAVAWTHHAEAWAARTGARVQQASEPPPDASSPATELPPAQTEAGVQETLGEPTHPAARRYWIRRYWAPVAGATAFVLCLASAGWVVWSWSRPEPEPPLTAPPPLESPPAAPTAAPPSLAATTPPPPSESAASAPLNAARPEETAGRPADRLASWAGALRQLGIPAVALQAYGYAEAVLATAKPRCRLSWTLLAGIGAVESNHGRYGGATLRPDGTTSRPIIGVPLAGGVGVELIRDTDGGTLDGDRTYDRAIGPMQFLPTTWRAWAVDADGNNRADPYDIDDAALAAGYYLCAGDQNLATGAGWSSAVFSYNRVPAYVERVYQVADSYGRTS